MLELNFAIYVPKIFRCSCLLGSRSKNCDSASQKNVSHVACGYIHTYILHVSHSRLVQNPTETSICLRPRPQNVSVKKQDNEPSDEIYPSPSHHVLRPLLPSTFRTDRPALSISHESSTHHGKTPSSFHAKGLRHRNHRIPSPDNPSQKTQRNPSEKRKRSSNFLNHNPNHLRQRFPRLSTPRSPTLSSGTEQFHDHGLGRSDRATF